MRRVIFLTDFSETARNALLYGIKMFREEKIEFFLLNAYDMEFSGSPYVMQVKDELAEESMKGLKNELSFLHKLYPNVSLQLLSRYGSLIEVLRNEISNEQTKPDFLVLGCRGETVLENFFLGSNAFDVIKHIDLPMIVVPRDAIYKKPTKIAFATDLKTIDEHIASPLYELAKFFEAELMFVNILEDGYIDRLEAEEIIANYFPGVKISFNFIDDPDIYKGICTFSADNDADMVAMVRYNYSFFERFFKPSITKKMVMQPQCPMVILHGSPK